MIKPVAIVNVSWSADHRVIDGATIGKLCYDGDCSNNHAMMAIHIMHPMMIIVIMMIIIIIIIIIMIAKFSNAWKQLIEHPEMMLMTLR